MILEVLENTVVEGDIKVSNLGSISLVNIVVQFYGKYADTNQERMEPSAELDTENLCQQKNLKTKREVEHISW